MFDSVSELQNKIIKKQITSETLIEATLAKIKALNPQINAIVYMAEETALANARECDKLLRQGKLLGSLHGIPFTVKDSILTAGLPTTAGTMGLRHNIPQKNATVVQRLINAGAIIIGKTNCPELEMTVDTDNLIFGRTKNPWNFDCSPGSSSGGEAAAIASGMVAFGIGEDTTCSLRLPAHYCGITTIKPTSGRVPRTGHIPNPGNILDGLWQLGPLARRVEDLEIILSLISGPDWIDPSVVPMPLEGSDSIHLNQLRIAYHTDNKIISPAAPIQNAIIQVINQLQGKVQTLVHAIPPGQHLATELCSKLYSLDKGVFIKKLLKDCGTKEMHPQMINLLADLETNFESLEVNQVLSDLYNYQSNLLQFFADIDVLVCPAMPSSARHHQNVTQAFSDQETNFNEAYNYFIYQLAYSLLGLPMMIIPICLDEKGLPITVQLVGSPWSEAKLFNVGKFLEREFSFQDNYSLLFSRLY